MIPSLIMHLYDYQSSVYNITMWRLRGPIACAAAADREMGRTDIRHSPSDDSSERRRRFAADQLRQREGVVPQITTSLKPSEHKNSILLDSF